MKKKIKTIIAIYLIASCVFSICHRFSDNPWNFRQHRNGLLCMEITKDDFVIYSPFCNYADVFLFGCGCDDDGWYTFSDGFYGLGEYMVK